jgi:chromosome segregation ATPase
VALPPTCDCIRQLIDTAQARARVLQKQQAIFEKTIRSSTDKKLKADDSLRVSISRMTDCELNVESCKSELQSLASTRVGLEKKLQAVTAELGKLESQHVQATRE